MTAAPFLLSTALGLAACTSGGDVAPTPSGVEATAGVSENATPRPSATAGGPTPAGPSSASGTGAVAAPTDSPDPAVPPGPSMTQIEPVALCTVRRPLTGGHGAVPLSSVFPGESSSSFSHPSEVVPGTDAADPGRCPGELPSRPACQSIVPWADLTDEEFAQASRVSRLVDGYLLTMPQLAGNQSPPESSPGTKVVTYRLLDVAPGDPGKLGNYLDGAFRTCARARDSTVAGVEALVGTVRSEYGSGSAQVVLLTRGSHVVWAQLDGSGWEPGERERALQVLVARLL